MVRIGGRLRGMVPDRRATSAVEYAAMASALVAVVLACAQLLCAAISASVGAVATVLLAM
jgi:hypothetical protein